LPSVSVAQPRRSMDQPSIAEYDDKIMQSMSVAQPRVSVNQPTNIEVRCQDARVDVETNDGQYVCTVCTMKHEVCGGEGGCTIRNGLVSTTEKRRERYSVIIANANGEPVTWGEEGTQK
jgi:hypothetical protein